MDKEFIGCCGAFCGTCPVRKENLCKGCKIGYLRGERDIKKAKCKIKVCCLSKNLDYCGLCSNYDNCEILGEFYGHDGYKYKKYKEANGYIREHGARSFVDKASNWDKQYGKLD